MPISIPKAIEIITDLEQEIRPDLVPDTHASLKLGIEALKRVQTCRPVNFYAPEILLPGETKE